MYIITGSVTSASRLAREAERVSGYPAYVVHTPSALRHGGCSYSVRCSESFLPSVKKAALETGVTIKGIYSEGPENGERVYRDIS